VTIRSHRSPVRRSTGPDHLTVEACLERAQYACEVNGCMLRGQRSEGWSLQHRLARGNGGTSNPRTNLPSNLLVVCGHGTAGCHGLIENELRAASLPVGWRLEHCACSRPYDCEHAPRRIPVLILRERWVLLTDQATYVDTTAPEEVA
jgi:hypothetical protein